LRFLLNNTSTSGNQSSFADCQFVRRDIVFVLDASGSVRKYFNLLKRFVREVIIRLKISRDETRVGLIVYSDTADVVFDTLEHTAQEELLSAFDEVFNQKGRTNTAAALRLLVSSHRNGNIQLRDEHKHVAIIVTDRISHNSRFTQRDAAALHAADIYDEIFAVGVGSANITELEIIASDPSHVLFDRNVDERAIDELQRSITHRLCAGKYLVHCLDYIN